MGNTCFQATNSLCSIKSHIITHRKCSGDTQKGVTVYLEELKQTTFLEESWVLISDLWVSLSLTLHSFGVFAYTVPPQSPQRESALCHEFVVKSGDTNQEKALEEREGTHLSLAHSGLVVWASG